MQNPTEPVSPPRAGRSISLVLILIAVAIVGVLGFFTFSFRQDAISLDEQLKKAEDFLAQEQATSQDLRVSVSDLEKSLQSSNEQLADTTQDLDKARQEQEQLLSEKMALADEKVVVEAQVTLLTERVDDALGEMSSLTDDLAGLQSTNSQLERDLAESNRALASVEGSLSTQSTELAKSRDREIELQGQLDASQLEAKSLQGQLHEKEGKLTGLESQIETLNKASESIHGSYGITEDGVFFVDIPLPDFAPLSDKLWLSPEEGTGCWINNPSVRFLRAPTEPEIDAISWSHRGDRLKVRSKMCIEQADSFTLWIAAGRESQLVLVYWLQL